MTARNIDVDLRARVDQFNRGFDEAEVRIERFDARVQGMNAEFAALSAGIVGAGGVVAALAAWGAVQVSAAMQTKDLLDDTGKLAQRLGMTTESLSELRYAGSLADASMEEMSVATRSLANKMQDAERGVGNAGLVFRAMNIDIHDVNGNLKTADVMFGEIADKFSGYRDGIRKTALATDLFGRTGEKLIPLLNGGAQGLRENAAEARQLGVVFDQELTRKAEAVNDNFTRLKTAGEGFKVKLASEVLPALVDVTNWMAKAAKEGGALYGVLAGLGVAGAKVFGVEINPMRRAENDATAAFNRVVSLKKAISDEEATLAADRGGLLGRGVSQWRLKGLKEDLATAEKELKSSTRRVAGLLEPLAGTEGTADAPVPETKSKATATKISDYQRLLFTLNEKIAVETADLMQTEKLSTAEKDFAKYSADLAAGRLKLTAAEKTVAGAFWETYLARAKANEEEKAAKKADDLVADYRRINAQTVDRINREADLALMNERGRTVAQALYKVEDEGAKIRERILRDLPEGAARTKALADADGELAAQIERVTAATEKSYDDQRTFEFGWRKAFQAYEDSASNAANTAKTAFTGLTGAMESGLRTFVKTGKMDFRSFGDAVINTLIDIQMQALRTKILAPMSQSIGGWIAKAFGFGGSSGAGSAGSMGNVVEPAVSSVAFAAKGAVFAGSNLHQYVNTVQTTPRTFAFERVQGFARGGVFAEAGPEAVMPLTRDGQGNLGVRASGTGAPSIAFNLINETGQAMQANARGTPEFDGERWVQDVVLRLIDTSPNFRAALGRT